MNGLIRGMSMGAVIGALLGIAKILINISKALDVIAGLR